MPVSVIVSRKSKTREATPKTPNWSGVKSLARIITLIKVITLVLALSPLPRKFRLPYS